MLNPLPLTSYYIIVSKPLDQLLAGTPRALPHPGSYTLSVVAAGLYLGCMHSSKEDGSEAFHGGHVRACVEPDSCGCLFISALQAASHSASRSPRRTFSCPLATWVPSRAGRAARPGLATPPALPARSRAGAVGAAGFSDLRRLRGRGGRLGPSLILCGRLLLARKVMKAGARSASGATWAPHLLPGPRQGPQRGGQSGP